MRQLASDLVREITAWDSEIAQVKERWEQILAIYRMDGTATQINVVDGMEGYATGVMTSKIDALVGNLTTAFFGTSPYWQCVTNDAQSEQSDDLERALQDIADKSGIEQTIAQAALKAALYNFGMVIAHPDEGDDGEFKGIKTDWIDPTHAFVWPLNVETIDRVRSVGHRYYLPQWEVEQLVESGEFFDYGAFGGSNTKEHELITGNDDFPSDIFSGVEDAQVELFQIIRKMKVGGKWDWYLIDFGFAGQKVLKFEKYPYRMPWYAFLRLLRTEKRIVGNDSIGFKAKGSQLLINDLVTTLVHGSYMSAFPPTFVSGGSLPSGTRTIVPGGLYEVDGIGAKIEAAPSNFNPGIIPEMIAQNESWMESVVGVSRLATNQNVPSDTKATTVNALTLNDQRRQNTIYETCSEGIERLGQIILMLFQAHYQEIATVYQGKTVLEDPSVLENKYVLKVTGKAGANPAELGAKLQGMIQLAMLPNSPLDLATTIMQTAEAADLPFDPKRLEKSSVTQAMAIIEQLQQAQIPINEVLQYGLQEWSDIQHAKGAGAALGGLSDQTANTQPIPAGDGPPDLASNQPLSGPAVEPNAQMPAGTPGTASA